MSSTLSSNNSQGSFLASFTPSAYIADGYSRPCYIAERPQLHPAVRFVFRPMLIQNVRVVARQILATTDARRQEEIAALAIQAQVVEWDLHKFSGELVPLTDIKEVLRIQPAILNRMYSIVSGEDGGDPDPRLERSQDDIQATAADLQRALAGEEPLSEAEADEKNLPVASG